MITDHTAYIRVNWFPDLQTFYFMASKEDVAFLDLRLSVWVVGISQCSDFFC